MKILLVVNSFPSVSETFIFNKVAALANRGHQVHVMCYKKYQLKDVFQNYQVNVSNIAVYEIGLRKSISSFIGTFFSMPSVFFSSISFSFQRFKKNYERNYYVKLINQIDFEIIHFEFSGIGVNFLPVIDRLKGFKVVSCRGTAEKVKLLVHDKRKDALTHLLRKVDLIHCVSEDIKKTILPYCNRPEKIFINTPAVDIQFFKPTSVKPAKDFIKLFSVGRIEFVKGYLIGLLAVKELVDKGYHIHWDIVGAGTELEEMQFHIINLKLTEHVTLLGKKTREEVNINLDSADIFILTSYSEGLPNVVLEGMSKELPVVTTRCGGVEEIIDHGIDGFIVDLYDHSGIAHYVEQLINDTTLQIKIGKAAREKIIAKFTVEKQIDTFEKYYRSLL